MRKRRKTATLRLVYAVRNYIPTVEEAKAGVQCGECGQWAHREYAGYERGGFMCEICVDD